MEEKTNLELHGSCLTDRRARAATTTGDNHMPLFSLYPRESLRPNDFKPKQPRSHLLKGFGIPPDTMSTKPSYKTATLDYDKPSLLDQDIVPSVPGLRTKEIDGWEVLSKETLNHNHDAADEKEVVTAAQPIESHRPVPPAFASRLFHGCKVPCHEISPSMTFQPPSVEARDAKPSANPTLDADPRCAVDRPGPPTRQPSAAQASGPPQPDDDALAAAERRDLLARVSKLESLAEAVAGNTTRLKSLSGLRKKVGKNKARLDSLEGLAKAVAANTARLDTIEAKLEGLQQQQQQLAGKRGGGGGGKAATKKLADRIKAVEDTVKGLEDGVVGLRDDFADSARRQEELRDSIEGTVNELDEVWDDIDELADRLDTHCSEGLPHGDHSGQMA
ncbi:hypothetical protein F4804DRAFT_336853 [Jackrogersella minutella]|nr:hypothetical protein F4804DRAFT_336853 [Jackrogersella minutella]